MDFFTVFLANIVISVIIIFLFRVLDKKNRSLEKLKRFSDKTKEEMSVFIRDKSLELNDLSVNIDAQLKKSREILTKILSFDEMLQGKSDDFDKMKKTIDTYDASLGELISMSGRVDENLKRLGEESVSVEKMGVKLKESGLRLAKMDAELKTTEHRFIEQARGELRETEERLIKTHEDKIHVLLGDVGRMEARAGELETYLKKLELKKQEAVKLAESAIGQALKGFEQEVGKKRLAETAGFKTEVDGVLKEAGAKNQAMADTLVRVESRLKELDLKKLEAVKLAESAIGQALAGFEQDLGQKRVAESAGFKAEVDAVLKEADDKNQIMTDTLVRVESRMKELDLKKQEAVKLAETAIGRALEGFAQDVAQKRVVEAAGFKAGVDAVLKDADDKNLVMADTLVRVESRMKELDGEFSAKIDDFKDQFVQVERMFYTHLESAAKRGEDFEDEVFLNLKKTIDEHGRASEREAEKFFQLTHAALEKRKKEIVELFGALRADTNIWHAELKKQMKQQEKEIETQLHDLEASAKSSIETFKGTAQKAEQKVEEKVGQSVSAMQARMKELEAGLAENRRVLTERTAGFEKDIRERIALLEKEAKSLVSSFDQEVTEKIAAAGSSAEGLFQRITVETNGVESRVLQSIEKRLGEYEAKAGKSVVAMQARLKELEAGIAESRRLLNEKTTGFEKEVRERIALLEKEAKSLVLSFDQEVTEKIAAASQGADGLFQKLAVATSGVEARVLESIEKRLGEYEDEAQYRFGKLEKANVDIEELERSLRASMASSADKIRSEFGSFSQSFEADLAAERERAEKELVTLREEIESIESGVNDLKTKAYENLSSKLKLVEDEFFNDIRGQSGDLKRKIAAWHEEIESTESGLSELKATAYKNVSSQLKLVEDEFFKDIRGQSGELKRKIADWREEIESTESGLSELKSTAYATVAATLKRVEDEFFKDFNSQSGALRQKITDGRQEIENIESGFGELKAKAYEKVSARLKRVEEEFFKDVRGQSGELKRKIAEWREEILKDIAGAETANAAEVEKLGLAHQKRLEKELLALRKSLEVDFQGLESRVGEFENGCEERIAAKEALLAGLSQKLSAEVESVRAKALSQIAGLTETVEKSRDKVFAAQKSFFDSFEQKRRDLEANLAEIEKQQKNFAAQTKLFERADGLKLGLEADLSQMKKDIGKIEAYRKDIDVISKEFFATKKMVDETGAKMRDFLTEKKRIDTIESDFQKLLALSRNIDEKLENAASQHDLVQGLTIKFRELESLETEVETRYTRLESRKNVVETVTHSVDKNFEQLTALEKNIKNFERELKVLPKLVGDVKQEVEFINESKDKTEKVVGKIEKLDDLLTDIEGRMEKLSVARDWLARTETRLEKVGKQAEDQLKLLETLVKDDVSRFKKEKGAPSLDKRQTVTKLARQGWSAEEIARATKLSRGEVELILELISDKVTR